MDIEQDKQHSGFKSADVYVLWQHSKVDALFAGMPKVGDDPRGLGGRRCGRVRASAAAVGAKREQGNVDTTAPLRRGLGGRVRVCPQSGGVRIT